MILCFFLKFEFSTITDPYIPAMATASSVYYESDHDQRLSFDHANEELGEFFAGRSKSIALLLVGPSGVGKTHLVESCATLAGVKLKRLRPQDLSDNNAGVVEATILSAFNPAIFEHETDNRTVCHVVFIDDLDIWAPSKMTSPLHIRIVATLNDVLQDVVYGHKYEDSQSHVRFIATSSTADSVHPSLVRPACINKVIRLSALSHSERQLWCAAGLKSLYHDPEHDKQLSSSISNQLAFMTPGFVHADMHRLFSSLSRHYKDDDFPKSPADLLQSSKFRGISRSFTPTLLSQLNPLLSSLQSLSCHPTQLHGMSQQLTQLNQCLNAVFSIQPIDPSNKRAARTVQALKNIRTLTGILIHGPTGCGKSALVHQATQVLPDNAVNVLPLDSASIVSSVVGQAERNLTGVFTVARMIAPTVIIIDNVDVIAPRRDDLTDNANSTSNDSFSRLLSTMLVQMDGIRSDSPSTDDAPVLVIATTRSFSLVDPALLRPGRIDVHVPVSVPNRTERHDIITHLLAQAAELSVPLNNINTDSLADRSDGWSTAEVLAYVRHEISKACADKNSE